MKIDVGNEKKKVQLGMPLGTASNRLRKGLLLKYVKLAKENYCFQCGAEITSERDFSIEHKTPYLDSENPVDLFFNFDNIAFSHLSCNVSVARRKLADHGALNTYYRGCRCNLCREANRLKAIRYRQRVKNRILTPAIT